MRSFYSLLILLCLALGASAQTQILDANLVLSSNNGTVHVYLNDDADLSTLHITIGSTAEDSSLYNITLGLGSGGSFYNSGTLTDNVLTLPVGTLPSNDEYFTRISVALTNGSSRTIDIHTEN